MKVLRFHFCHPFKGRARILLLATGLPYGPSMEIESIANHHVEIPVHQCSNGKYKLVLSWEHDGRSFFHEKEFEIKEEKELLDPPVYF